MNGTDRNTDAKITPNKHATTTKSPRSAKLWLWCVFVCSYVFEATLIAAGRARRRVTPTRLTLTSNIYNHNKFFCSDLILDFVWACISTAERVEPHDAEGKMSWQKHVTQPVNRGCSVLQAIVMLSTKYGMFYRRAWLYSLNRLGWRRQATSLPYINLEVLNEWLT